MQLLILFLAGLAIDIYLYVQENRAKQAEPNAPSSDNQPSNRGLLFHGQPGVAVPPTRLPTPRTFKRPIAGLSFSLQIVPNGPLNPGQSRGTLLNHNGTTFSRSEWDNRERLGQAAQRLLCRICYT